MFFAPVFIVELSQSTGAVSQTDNCTVLLSGLIRRKPGDGDYYEKKS